MSLDWNVADVKDYETVCKCIAKFDDPMEGIKKGDTIWTALTLALPWACLGIGLSGITQKNYRTFAARLAAWEEVSGPLLLDQNNPARRITLDEIKSYIGLRTNVSNESAAWFERKLAAIIERREEQAAKRAG